jgi:murein DD-endopeptidase MepM/ murein hydrolase activator NlpD
VGNRAFGEGLGSSCIDEEKRQRALARLPTGSLERINMSNIMTATPALFRDRDLFVHDGAHLRRIRLSAPVQALFFFLLMALVGWSGFAAARLATGNSTAITLPKDLASLAAATEMRARQIEQRQAILAAMISGEKVDASAIPAATPIAILPGDLDRPLSRAEAAQLRQASATTRAFDERYRVTAAELKKLGLTPARFGETDVGGPYQPVTSADPTFKQLFMSWKKLDQLQNGAIAVPSDKPVKTAAFTSGFGERSDPFMGRRAMHPGIDLSGPVGTPIFATADGTVLRSGWNNGGYGNLIELDHGRGINTRYGHLSAILVHPGQAVKRGDLIGRMGSTGRSTGSHLHYEVRIDGRAVNPIPFMKSTDYLVAIQHKAGGASMDQVAVGGPQR